MSGQAVKAVAAAGSKIQVGTFDVNADVVQNVLDGKLCSPSTSSPTSRATSVSRPST